MAIAVAVGGVLTGYGVRSGNRFLTLFSFAICVYLALAGYCVWEDWKRGCANESAHRCGLIQRKRQNGLRG